ncbi:MAG: GNAT family N-acetyltransferase [Campylobacterales bacterium]|nr:GNAT family N-acetyltransferase [Campylobacterales bacterium]
MCVEIVWFRQDLIPTFVAETQKEGWLIDEFEIERTIARFPTSSFALLVDGKLAGGITTYFHEKTAWIGNFLVFPEYRKHGYGKRLFETVLKELDGQKSIYLNANPLLKKFYKSYGFNECIEVIRLKSKKELSNKAFTGFGETEQKTMPQIAMKLDGEFFCEDRGVYLSEDAISKSSIYFATPNGFLHSRMIGGIAFVGPFEVRSGAYLDAERMFREFLHFRGMKEICLDVPKIDEILSFFVGYGFEESSRTMQMVKGEDMFVEYENIYAFASAGSLG